MLNFSFIVAFLENEENSTVAERNSMIFEENVGPDEEFVNDFPQDLSDPTISDSGVSNGPVKRMTRADLLAKLNLNRVSKTLNIVAPSSDVANSCAFTQENVLSESIDSDDSNMSEEENIQRSVNDASTSNLSVVEKPSCSSSVCHSDSSAEESATGSMSNANSVNFPVGGKNLYASIDADDSNSLIGENETGPLNGSSLDEDNNFGSSSELNVLCPLSGSNSSLDENRMIPSDNVRSSTSLIGLNESRQSNESNRSNSSNSLPGMYPNDLVDESHSTNRVHLAIGIVRPLPAGTVLTDLSILDSRIIYSHRRPDGTRKKTFVFPMRKMMCPIRDTDLNKYGVDFFLQNCMDFRLVIRHFPHSLRFWLAVKFCRMMLEYRPSSDSTFASYNEQKFYARYSPTEICFELGIAFRTVSSCVSGKHKFCFPSSFKGLSPLENSRMANNVYFFALFALNLRNILDCGRFTTDQIKAGMERNNMNFAIEMDKRQRLMSVLDASAE